jgi:hypothetical protein
VIFWIAPEYGNMCIDNCSLSALDLSSIDPTIRMVQWQENAGRIERKTGPALREVFLDPIPYLPSFDLFITTLNGQAPPITLDQAKKIKIDLNRAIFDAKRQAPIEYLAKTWDATDDEVTAMNSELSMVSALSGGGSATDIITLSNNLNQLAFEVNSRVVAPGNNADGNICQQVNFNVRGAVNTIVDQANYSLAYNKSLVIGAVNADVVTPLKDNTFPKIQGKFDAYETRFEAASWPGGVPGDYPPDPPNITPINDGVYIPSGITQLAAALSAPPGMTNVTVPAGGGDPADTTIEWYALGELTPTVLTVVEFSGLINTISARRAVLAQTQRTKRAEILACSTVAQVIAIDLASGWPT